MGNQHAGCVDSQPLGAEPTGDAGGADQAEEDVVEAEFEDVDKKDE